MFGRALHQWRTLFNASHFWASYQRRYLPFLIELIALNKPSEWRHPVLFILFDDLFRKVTRLLVEKLLCKLHERLTLCHHGVLGNAEVDVYRRHTSKQLPCNTQKSFCQEHQLWPANVESATYLLSTGYFTVCKCQNVHIHCNQPCLPLFDHCEIESAFPSHTEKDFLCCWRERA